MYLKKCFIKNMGPINELNFNFPFKGNKPLPIVFVGKNGAGKSIILSHIVDALCEMGKSVYEDVIKSNSEFKKPFLRLVGPINQKMGEKFGIALLYFGLLNEDNVGISYVEKTGDLDFNEFFSNKNGDFPGLNAWNNTENFKALGSFNNEKFDLKKILHEGTYAYFPVTRRETPHWLNPESLEENIGPNIYKRINGRLNKQIFVETATNLNRQWILDLCLDSMVFISKEESPDQYQLQSERTSDLNTRMLQTATISSVEKVLKAILQDDNACFFLNPRNSGHFRLGVKNNERHLIPSLDHLSSGQASLFNIFTTLIRYADLGNSSGAIDLKEISGVVIIDEIDAHAHSDLQYQVIPQLISMFPKIQFIMTSHEPLFLMGLASSLGGGKYSNC